MLGPTSRCRPLLNNKTSIFHLCSHIKCRVFHPPHFFIPAVVAPRPEFTEGRFIRWITCKQIDGIEHPTRPQGAEGFVKNSARNFSRNFVEQQIIGHHIEMVVWELAVFVQLLEVMGFHTQLDRAHMSIADHRCGNISAPDFRFRPFIL
jgi:hypothetical protein